MPSRNIIRLDSPDAYYHVYARGISKQPIFIDDADYQYFLGLLARYLAPNELRNINGELYPYYGEEVNLLCYCLMPNHFHLLFYQQDLGGISLLMRSIMTSYSRYFNKRYKRTGSLFESRYKAALIDNQSYLEHISRYIHLNPRYWQRYKYSSINYYLGQKSPKWLKPAKIENMFSSPQDYLEFTKDYEGQKIILKEIKHSLADH